MMPPDILIQQEQALRQAIVQEALTWQGTPYHHQARIKGVGVDCVMLLCEVYQAVGLLDPMDPRPYSSQWHLHHHEERYLNGILRYAKMVTQPKMGDVALFKFGRCFSHGAIIIGHRRLIHAYVGDGCFIHDMDEAPLQDRAAHYFSWWGND